MSVEIGIDSKYFTIDYRKRNNEKISFESMVGVAVVTKNPLEFRERFEEISKNVFKEFGIKTGKKILSSYEIMEKTKGDIKAHQRIFNLIRREPIKVNIFYSSFNQKRIPLIKTYGKTGSLREMELREFYDEHLRNSFNHVCAWKLDNHYYFGPSTEVFIDNFFTYTTNAWEKIKNKNIRIIPSGDKCNYLICIADIVLKYLEYRLKQKRKSLYLDCIKEALGYNRRYRSELHTHIIHNRHLPYITPLEKKNTGIDKFIKHPCFFIMRPAKTNIDLDIILSKSDELVNSIYDNNGCVCFFNQRRHKDCIEDNDFLVYFDEEGFKNAKLMKKLVKKDIKIKKYEEFQ